MKLLKHKFLLLVLFASAFFTEVKGQTSAPLDGFYQNFYRIANRNDTGKRNWVTNSSNEFLSVGEISFGRGRWLVMPTHPGSNDFIIADKSTGKVIDISRGPNQSPFLILFDFNGGNNQVFNLSDIPNEIPFFHVFSPEDPQKSVVAPGIGLRLEFGPHNPNIGNRKMRLFPLETIPNGLTSFIPQSNEIIAQPPTPTSLEAEDQCIQCNEQVVGETILPFVMVKNDWPSHIQAEHNPYYKVVRKQYWQMVGNPKRVNPGSITEIEYIQTQGIERFQQKTVSETLEIGFTVEGSVGFEAFGVGASVSASFSESFELNTTQVNSVTETSTEQFRFTRIYNVNTASVFIEYQLVDKYVLERMDGSKVTEWEVARSPLENTEVAFPIISRNGASARTMVAANPTLENSPLVVEEPASTEVGYSARVAANPFTDVLEVKVNTPENATVTAALYNHQGEEVKSINETIARQGAHTITIDGNNLPKGMYILKGYITGGDNAKEAYDFSQRVIKE